MRKLFSDKNILAQCVCVVIITAFWLFSWHSVPFGDWYRTHLFPYLSGWMARLSSLAPFSVGEALIVIGIAYIIVGVLLLFLWLAGWIAGKEKGGPGKRRMAAIRKWYARLLCWILVYVYATETFHCYMLYHTSTVEEQYYHDAPNYGQDGLLAAYRAVVEKANALSGKQERDADGQLCYSGDLYAACKKAMAALGSEYPYFSGYYPDPKPIHASDFMSQQYLMGIYFPFTMEANYNTVMHPVNFPPVICHELSHLKGIIREDEANYFGFLACIRSEDAYLQYAGYISVLGYLAKQIRESVPGEIRETLAQANGLVQRDDVFLTDGQWERVEKKAAFSTETVNKATDAFLEANLAMNGVPEGMESYSQVVRLVIDYYNYEETGEKDYGRNE